MKPTWKPLETPYRGGTISKQERDSWPDSVFAFPKHRSIPLPDANHVHVAIPRFCTVKGVTEEDRNLAYENVKEAAKHFNVTITWKGICK